VTYYDIKHVFDDDTFDDDGDENMDRNKIINLYQFADWFFLDYYSLSLSLKIK
jgi:hypothetical protein